VNAEGMASVMSIGWVVMTSTVLALAPAAINARGTDFPSLAVGNGAYARAGGHGQFGAATTNAGRSLG
jgi:hypothetical protein